MKLLQIVSNSGMGSLQFLDQVLNEFNHRISLESFLDLKLGLTKHQSSEL